MNDSRRKFLKIASLSAAGIALCPLAGCHDNGLNPYSLVSIDNDLCIGCSECLPYCTYKAIKLPEPTQYEIDREECVECGDCVEICPQEAIFIVSPKYYINEVNCVGCGDCIAECENEGNCIHYEKEYYTVRNKCRPHSCHTECIGACPEDAIIIDQITGKATINLDRCTRCGECVHVCPRNAINPAKVTIDQDDCTQCGKCVKVCDPWLAVERQLPDNYREPKIDMDICTSCGECIEAEACPDYSAITRTINYAKIDGLKCKICGDCIQFCRFDAIKKR